MDIQGLFNKIMAAYQQNQRKMSVEMVKDAIDNNNLPKEYNDVLKSIIDLGFVFFEERNYNKAKAECGKLALLIDKYQKLHKQ